MANSVVSAASLRWKTMAPNREPYRGRITQFFFFCRHIATIFWEELSVHRPYAVNHGVRRCLRRSSFVSIWPSLCMQVVPFRESLNIIVGHLLRDLKIKTVDVCVATMYIQHTFKSCNISEPTHETSNGEASESTYGTVRALVIMIAITTKSQVTCDELNRPCATIRTMLHVKRRTILILPDDEVTKMYHSTFARALET